MISVSHVERSGISSRLSSMTSPRKSAVATEQFEGELSSLGKIEGFLSESTSSSSARKPHKALYETNKKKVVPFVVTPGSDKGTITRNMLDINSLEKSNETDRDGHKDGNGDDDYSLFDDLSEIMSVCTMNSSAKQSNKTDRDEGEDLNSSFAAGKMFFYVEKGIILPRVQPVTNSNNESTRNDSNVNISQSLIVDDPQKYAIEFMLEKGQAMYEKGVRLLERGKVKKACKALSDATKIQKDTTYILARLLAKCLHRQGQHLSSQKGNENTHSATMLFGLSEVLKQDPSADNILLVTKIHSKIRKSNEKENQALYTEVYQIVKVLGRLAKPTALTMQTYAKAIDLVGKQKLKRRRKQQNK